LIRIFLYDAASVALGLVLFFTAMLTFSAWNDARVFPGVWAKLVALLIIAGASAAILYFGRSRSRWIGSVGRYQSFSAFAKSVKENRGGDLIKGLGVYMVDGVGFGLGSLVKAIHEAPKEMSVREAYELLQRQRREGRISEREFHQGIDELFLAACGKTPV
jgi:hypothetical protein